MKPRSWLFLPVILIAAWVLTGIQAPTGSRTSGGDDATARTWMRCFFPTRAYAQAAGQNQVSQVTRPAITGVAFIMLRTSNETAAREFYGHVLGLTERDSSTDVEPPPPPPGQPQMAPPKIPLIAPLDGLPLIGHHAHTRFYVNPRQYVELLPGLADANQDRLVGIGFETADIEGMSAYLRAQGVQILGPLPPPDVGAVVKDPDGHLVAFVEFRDEPGNAPSFSQQQEADRLSQRMIHVGITVKDKDAADRFYRDVLGFKEIWHGGMKDDRTDWVDMRVPDGTDWLEYMLNVQNPMPRTLGVMHHLALGVESVAEGYKTVVARGYKAGEPKIGRDGKWQLNLYDPDLSRVELMEPKPVQKPCCAPMLH